MQHLLNILLAVIVCLLIGCTDLNITNQIDQLADESFEEDEDFVLYIAPAYLSLRNLTAVGSWLGLQEISSDEACAPIRGFQWSDQHWIDLHRHQWLASNPLVRSTWHALYQGVAECNRLIKSLEILTGPERAPYVAELRALRAFYYMYLIDAYGDVPLITDFDDVQPPARSSRAEVFTFIESELVEARGLLLRDVNQDTYGRITYFGAQAILANLYLNAEIYSGVPRWDDCIGIADDIIESNQFVLTENYFDNFQIHNETSSEFIFAIPYHEKYAIGFNLVMATLHSDAIKTYNLESQPWNGWCTLEDFFDSYADHDQRKGNGKFPGSFIYGQQFTANGDTLLQDTSFLPFEPDDPDGLPVNYRPHIKSLDSALLQDGARIGKFEIEMGGGPNMNNDFPIFRYTRILLNKAEAHWRMGQMDEALELFNQVRSRSGLEAESSLSTAVWLEELGREFFMESFRRSDLIRFDKFNSSWWEKEQSDDCKNIFPIPADQLDENLNLIQNPCY